jgi:hypothetical protein
MKKLLTLALALTLTLSLAACGGTSNSGNGGSTTTPLANSGDTTPATSSTAGNNTATAWPDNEYTQQVPKPDGTVINSSVENLSVGTTTLTSFIAQMSWSKDEAKAYGAALKSAGFTERSLEDDSENYMYAASNGSYDVAIAVSTETNNYTISISKSTV